MIAQNKKAAKGVSAKRLNQAVKRAKKPNRKLEWAKEHVSNLLPNGRELWDKAVKGTKNEAARQFEGMRYSLSKYGHVASFAPYSGTAAAVARDIGSRAQKKHSEFMKKWDPGGNKWWNTWSTKFVSSTLGLGESSASASPKVSILDCQVGPTITETPGPMGVAGKCALDRWHINDGASNKQLQLAKDMYKLRTVPIYETGYSKHPSGGVEYMAAQNSQCGINRRGWYLPWLGSSAFQNYVSEDGNAGKLVYDSAGTLQARHLYKFWSDNLTTAVKDYMNDENTGNVELYLPLQSTWSTHQIENRMTQSSVTVSAYLVRCKEDFLGHPMRSVYNWDIPPSTASGETDLAPTKAPDGNYYMENRIQKTISAGVVGNTGSPGVVWDIETITRPGITPAFSPKFRKHFEIVDVMHKEIEPQDSWELTFKRTFARPLKWTTFKAMFKGDEPLSTQRTYDYIREGDYEVFFSFIGNPGTASGFAMGKISGIVDPATGDPTVKMESFDPITVQSHRSRIAKTVSHSLSVAWPNASMKEKDGTAVPDELKNNGFITVSERLTDAGEYWAAFERQVTDGDGEKYLVPNWRAIGTAVAAPVLGSTDARVEGTDSDTFKKEL